MLDFEALIEIVEKFRENLFIANRGGEQELNFFLTKHNINISKKECIFSYIDVRNSQILVVGNLNIKHKDIVGLCKDIGIEPERLVFVSYDEATNYPFDSLRYSNKYSDVIIGATPHKGRGIGDCNSIITYLQSTPEEFPKFIIAEDSNGLNLNKTTLRNSLLNTRLYEELVVNC